MEEWEIQTTFGVWTGEDYRPLRSRIFLSRNSSSCLTEKFHSEESCLETVDRRTPNNLKNRQWTTEGDAVRDDRHLLSMTVYDCTASSRQLVARWSTAIGVVVSASLIPRRLLHCKLRASVTLYRIPLTTNHPRLHTQWVHEHRAR